MGETNKKQTGKKILGLAATAYTTEQLEKNEGKFLIKSYGLGKYGRVLGEIFLHNQSKSLNQLLIEEGHAYVYDGGKKKLFKG